MTPDRIRPEREAALGAVVIRRAAMMAARRDGTPVLRRISNRQAKRRLDLRLDINIYGRGNSQ